MSCVYCVDACSNGTILNNIDITIQYSYTITKMKQNKNSITDYFNKNYNQFNNT